MAKGSSRLPHFEASASTRLMIPRIKLSGHKQQKTTARMPSIIEAMERPLYFDVCRGRPF
ncbi:MAG: hypothetical protein PUH12_04220 [Lachnospiraceae bacterium]|nr:hypothetical protein [Lachnospiraceae bacterium]